ncbi:hypothetical protein JXL21_09160 [Candidatus Bathyarchaeota archaeon]|nr:hypothetical protein [Candidatus Bathyarchaeota archaeon]
MEPVKKALYGALIVLVVLGGSVVVVQTHGAHRYMRRELTGYRAFLMVDRYAYSSMSHSYIRITETILDEYPRLADAFVVGRGITLGSHPSEWVQCTEEEGLELLELLGRLPREGAGPTSLLYKGEKYVITVVFGDEAPVIS